METTETISNPAEGPLTIPSENCATLPFQMVRAAVFAARAYGKSPRPDYTDRQVELVAYGQKSKVIQTAGEQLDNQLDLDIFTILVRWANQKGWFQSGSAELEFKESELRRLCGRDYSGGGVDVRASLNRLLRGAFEFHYQSTDGPCVICTRLILKHDYPKELENGKGRRHRVFLDRKLISLFRQGWVLVQDKQLAQAADPLTKALLWFYSTHAEPFPITLEYLYKLFGSCGRLKQFKEMKLPKALERLKEITGWTCWIADNKAYIKKPVKDASPAPATRKRVLDVEQLEENRKLLPYPTEFLRTMVYKFSRDKRVAGLDADQLRARIVAHAAQRDGEGHTEVIARLEGAVLDTHPSLADELREYRAKHHTAAAGGT